MEARGRTGPARERGGGSPLPQACTALQGWLVGQLQEGHWGLGALNRGAWEMPKDRI